MGAHTWSGPAGATFLPLRLVLVLELTKRTKDLDDE
jgi:hypothetical protein